MNASIISSLQVYITGTFIRKGDLQKFPGLIIFDESIVLLFVSLNNNNGIRQMLNNRMAPPTDPA